MTAILIPFRPRHRLAALITISTLLTPLSAAATDRDGSWWDGFGPSGVDGGVYCLTEHFEDLYVGGYFGEAGGIPAANFARFNGRHWLDVDTGTDDAVTCIYSSATTITIGGDFYNAGGTACSHVADLYLGEWTPMGDYMPDWWPNVFTGHNLVLYAGGTFDSDGDWYYSPLARWDGIHWHDVFDGWDPTVECNDLAHFDGSLFLGGNFTFDAFDPDIENFTEWTGDDLIDYGFLNGDIVNCLQVHDNALYIGGSFSASGSTGSYGLAWLSDGRLIHPAVQPDVPRIVVDLTVWNSVLLVGQTDAVIPYNGAAWLDTLGGVLDGSLTSVCTIGIDLYVSGSFTGSVARWDNWWDEWVQIGGSPGATSHERNYMRALCKYDGYLVAGGEFSVPTILAAEEHCAKIGLWDGEAWHRMGSGINSTVYDLAAYDGDLIAAGHFDHAGGSPAQHLALWDGTDWQDIGGANADVHALTVWNHELVAGGGFSQVGGLPADRIATWDGSDWSSLGSGTNGTVHALTVFDGDLYAGGSFTTAGGAPAYRIARWDGSQWHAVGDGVNNIVYALGRYQGDLIAGGYFDQAGGAPASGIARWDGNNWHALGAGVGGTGLTYPVMALQEVAGELIVGGEFTEAGGAPAGAIAAWDGAAWSEYEGGVQDGYWRTIVYDMQVHDGDLYLAGDFSTVGGRGEVSYNLARWVDGTLTPIFLQEFDLAVEVGAVTATWQIAGMAGTGQFELTGQADDRTWIVAHQSDGATGFRAVDRSPRAGDDGSVTYTLRYRAGGGEIEMLAQEMILLPLPDAVRLLGAHPNPFNPGTTVAFELDRPQAVQLDVYDLTGQRVMCLAEGPYTAGRHEVPWDGRDRHGREVASGTYLVRLQAAGNVEGQKLLLVR